jgi:hypothetical protein
MVIICPKCQAHLKLTQLPCGKCQIPIEVDKNLVGGKPVMVCPECKTRQVIGRLKCVKCQTLIDIAGAPPPKPAAPGDAAPAPAPAPGPEAPGAPAAPGDVPVFENSPVLVAILGIVTLGFYMLYWCPKAAAVLNAITKGKQIGSVMAILAGLNFCTPATIKFYWRAAGALGENKILMLLLSFIPMIAAAVVQSKINRLYEDRP